MIRERTLGSFEMSQRRDNRIAAMQYLYQWSINRPEDLRADLRDFFANKERPRDYYPFAEELIFGALEKVDEVDAVIRQYTQNWDFQRVARIDLAILRLAIYEMLFRRDIPPVVSINEAIDLSKEYSNPDAKRFINGILDQFKLTLDRPLRSAGTL
ncbi:MAG: transcription antitermination factor NusB [Opitutales bacterium]|nr:transcription antitermination factor NusB [Opitutales bacterium]